MLYHDDIINGNAVIGGFPDKGAVMQSFEVVVGLSLNKLL